jgi:hypothetical protein
MMRRVVAFWANIPRKTTRKAPFCFSSSRYKKHNLVERFFNKLRCYRWIATRYKSFGSSFFAIVKLASIRLRSAIMRPAPNDAAPLDEIAIGIAYGLPTGYRPHIHRLKASRDARQLAFRQDCQPTYQ